MVSRSICLVSVLLTGLTLMSVLMIYDGLTIISTYKSCTPGYCDSGSAVLIASRFTCNDYKMNGYLHYNPNNKTYSDKVDVTVSCSEDIDGSIRGCRINLNDDRLIHEAYYRVPGDAIMVIVISSIMLLAELVIVSIMIQYCIKKRYARIEHA